MIIFIISQIKKLFPTGKSIKSSLKQPGWYDQLLVIRKQFLYRIRQVSWLTHQRIRRPSQQKASDTN